MLIEDRIYNGDRAREVLENEQFIAALTDIKMEVTEQWKNSPARDAEGREKLWTMLKLAEKMEATLRTRLETGVMAKMDLKHRESLADRAKSALGFD